MQWLRRCGADEEIFRVRGVIPLNKTAARSGEPAIQVQTGKPGGVGVIYSDLSTVGLIIQNISSAAGLAVPMPTLPLALMSIELVGAPGRTRKGKREPPVTSRKKKLDSFPA